MTDLLAVEPDGCRNQCKNRDKKSYGECERTLLIVRDVDRELDSLLKTGVESTSCVGCGVGSEVRARGCEGRLGHRVRQTSAKRTTMSK